MAKEKPSTKAAKAPKTAAAKGPSVAAIRSQIDKVDREIVQLLNQRAKYALQVGKLKDSAGETIYSPGREEEVLARVLELNKGPLSPECIRAVYREIISGSRSLEKHLKVAYLGPAHSYSHQAALCRFGQSVDLVPVGTIAAVFEEVNRKHVDYGIVPIENSTDGRIADSLDMFTRLPVRICGEVPLWIHHCLLARCPRSDITEIYSRPQAISQCRNWLAKHLAGARVVEVTSTSTAAQLAQDKHGVAAIASAQAAAHYGLNVVADNIEDNQSNLTRFVVIGHQPADRTGKDKTSLMFEVEHRPGALADAMNIFKRNRLNLTWIESFPIPQRQGSYLFFVELDGHQNDLRVRRTTDALARRAVRMSILGSYPVSAPVG